MIIVVVSDPEQLFSLTTKAEAVVDVIKPEMYSCTYTAHPWSMPS